MYGACDGKLNRDVAQKVLPAELARDPDRLSRFKHEAQVLAALNHPHIAAIHGFEDSDGPHSMSSQCCRVECFGGLSLEETGEVLCIWIPRASMARGRGCPHD